MLAFWVEASVTQTDVVDDLVRRDWVATDGSTYELTDHGLAAVSRIEGALGDLKAQALLGLDPESVAAAAEVLGAIAANLEALLPPRR